MKTAGGSANTKQCGSIISSIRVSTDSPVVSREGRVSTSSPLPTPGVMHGSPVSDDSSQHSGSGILDDSVSNGVVNHSRFKQLDNALCYKCILVIYALANDPSPQVARLGQRVLSIIGIEQLVTKSTGVSVRSGQQSAPGSSFGGLLRSSSWLDMNGGNLLWSSDIFFLFTKGGRQVFSFYFYNTFGDSTVLFAVCI